MTIWMIVTEHPPQLCQTSSRTCAAKYREFLKWSEHVAGRAGLKVLAGPLITSDHRGFFTVESDGYEEIRRFCVDSGLLQWNSMTTIPVITAQQALEELDQTPPIWP